MISIGLKPIIKLFRQGNVCITGLVGAGKDMLFSNVIARRKAPYCSNIDYGGRYAPFEYEYINIPNGYKELIHGDIHHYESPLPRGTDIYLSDCGIYFPSQYNNELDKHFPSLSEYMSLSRHLNRSHVHLNCQTLNRVYLKIREMSDIYIRCVWCKVLKIPFIRHKLVIQRVVTYDKYESCLDRLNPCRIRVPLTANKEARMSAKLYLDNFYNQHGNVKKKLLIYRHKGTYDTHHFHELFKRGVKDNEKAL